MTPPSHGVGPVAFSNSSPVQSPITQNVQPQQTNVPRVSPLDHDHDNSRTNESPSQLQRHAHNSDPVSAPRSSNISPAPNSSTSKPQTVFIHKLYDMLEDPSLSHLIWWSPTDDSFCLYPGEEFSNVLAHFFKHTNIASFIRQLNMYGFQKVSDNFQSDDKMHSSSGGSNNSSQQSQPTKWEFRHSANHFRKGDVESLNLIKRKSSKVMNSHKEIVSLKTLPPTSDAPVDDPRSQNDPSSQERYHSSVFNQSWSQLGAAGGKSPPNPKDIPRQHPPSALAHPHFPPFPQNMLPPQSPGSPSVPDASGSTQSYFVQSPSQPSSSQPQSRQTSVQTPALSLDSSINLKLIELSSVINNLGACYQDLLARHETLSAMYRKGQTDLLQLTEIVEHLTRSKQQSANKDTESKPETIIDRKMALTPVNRAQSPGNVNASPTTVRPSPEELDITLFKNSLEARLSEPAEAAAQSVGIQLKAPASDNLPKVPGSVIIPQHYPLNPNYTLYNKPETPLTPFPATVDEKSAPVQSAQSNHRHFSMLLDPLQPVPSRSTPSSIGVPVAQNAPGNKENSTTPVTSMPPMEENSRPQGSKDANSQPFAPTYIQQYQPRAPAHVYYKHVFQAHNNQTRTTSLPAMPSSLPVRMEQYAPQRHSSHNIQFSGYQSTEPDSMRKSSMSTRAPVTPPITSKPFAPYKEASVGSEQEEQQGIKNQLPSMEELNKSLRSGSPTSGIFNLHQNSTGDEETNKKRKIED